MKFIKAGVIITALAEIDISIIHSKIKLLILKKFKNAEISFIAT